MDDARKGTEGEPSGASHGRASADLDNAGLNRFGPPPLRSFATEAEAYEAAVADAKAAGRMGRIWPDPDYWPVTLEQCLVSVGAMLIARERGWARDVEAWLTDPLVLLAVNEDEKARATVEDCRRWLEAQATN